MKEVEKASRALLIAILVSGTSDEVSEEVAQLASNTVIGGIEEARILVRNVIPVAIELMRSEFGVNFKDVDRERRLDEFASRFNLLQMISVTRYIEWLSEGVFDE